MTLPKRGWLDFSLRIFCRQFFLPPANHRRSAALAVLVFLGNRSPADSLKHFTESRAKTLAFLKETKGLRDHAIDSPLGKKLDAYQWVLFIAAHSERHTKQINEVKADPNFPKK